MTDRAAAQVDQPGSQSTVLTEPEFMAGVVELAHLFAEQARLQALVTASRESSVADDPVAGTVLKHVTTTCADSLDAAKRRGADLMAAFQRLRRVATASPSWLDRDSELASARSLLRATRDELVGLRGLPLLDADQARRVEALVPEVWKLERRIRARVERLLVELAHDALTNSQKVEAQ